MNGLTHVHGTVSLTLHPHAKAVAAARRFVTSVVGELIDEQRRSDLEVLVSEVVSNGVMHAGTTMELLLSTRDDLVRVELVDHGIGEPQLSCSAGPGGGFGLRIVAGLSRRWGVDHHEHGKTVWFEI